MFKKAAVLCTLYSVQVLIMINLTVQCTVYSSPSVRPVAVLSFLSYIFSGYYCM